MRSNKAAAPAVAQAAKRIYHGSIRKAPAIGAITVAVAFCFAHLGCKRHSPPKISPQTTVIRAVATGAFSYTSEVLPSDTDRYFLGSNDLSFEFEPERILLHASGSDPNITMRVETRPGSRVALDIDMESTVDTVFELYYERKDSGFSPEDTLRSVIRRGHNHLLFEIEDPRFTGAIRLDPGEKSGDYAIRSISVFSPEPVDFAFKVRPQSELAAIFETVNQQSNGRVLWRIATPVEQAAVSPLKDAVLKPSLAGLQIQATGTDCSTILPEFDATQPNIWRIRIQSSEETMLQLFYKVAGQIEYDAVHSYSARLRRGENVIYFEHRQSRTAGPFRLDPGMVVGRFVLEELDVRSLAPNRP
jgi:hypothetical protein